MRSGAGGTDLRENEASSIRAFVQKAADQGYLSGRVLDFGCGKQPYRDIVEAAGGKYYPLDRKDFPANLSGADIGVENYFGSHRYADAILCTQVVQYIPMGELIGDRDFTGVLERWAYTLGKHGHLVLTYPTNWPEVETEDLHRFTKAGMERLLMAAGFTIVAHEWRHGFSYQGVSFVAGYGVIARA